MKNFVLLLCVTVLVALAPAVQAGQAAGAEPDFRALYKKCAPAVVTVTVAETVPYGVWKRTVNLLNPFPIFDTPGDAIDFATYPLLVLLRFEPLKYGGSGVIIDKEGHFLTNHHVVDPGNVYWATLNDRRVIRARLVGSDAAEDYALLKLELKEGETVTPAPLGDSGALRPGDRVFAIGSPLGLRQTLSQGVVAAVERRCDGPFQDFLQTDLTIGSGSSGGPLFNERGEVVGLTTLMYAVLRLTGGVTCSVPIDNVKEGLAGLKKDGRVTRGYIGATIHDVTPRLAERHDLKAKAGACVTAVEDNVFLDTPAYDAGLRVGDVIVRFGTFEVERAKPLVRRIFTTRPGTTVQVEVLRKGSRLTLKMKVGER